MARSLVLSLLLLASASASADCLVLSNGTHLTGAAEQTTSGWIVQVSDGLRLPLVAAAVQGTCPQREVRVPLPWVDMRWHWTPPAPRTLPVEEEDSVAGDKAKGVAAR